MPTREAFIRRKLWMGKMDKLSTLKPRIATIDTRRCAKIDFAKEQYEERRGTATERGYDHTWKKIRDAKLARDPLCERCSSRGRTTVAVLVHHKDRNPKNNQPDNHMSICERCHYKEHTKDNKNNRMWGRVKSLGSKAA